jgi:hypothetical protein
MNMKKFNLIIFLTINLISLIAIILSIILKSYDSICPAILSSFFSLGWIID